MASVGALKRREVMRDIVVEVAYFAGYRADDFGLVGRKVGEGLGAFGVLDLFFSRQFWFRLVTAFGGRRG